MAKIAGILSARSSSQSVLLDFLRNARFGEVTLVPFKTVELNAAHWLDPPGARSVAAHGQLPAPRHASLCSAFPFLASASRTLARSCCLGLLSCWCLRFTWCRGAGVRVGSWPFLASCRFRRAGLEASTATVASECLGRAAVVMVGILGQLFSLRHASREALLRRGRALLVRLGGLGLARRCLARQLTLCRLAACRFFWPARLLAAFEQLQRLVRPARAGVRATRHLQKLRARHLPIRPLAHELVDLVVTISRQGLEPWEQQVFELPSLGSRQVRLLVGLAPLAEQTQPGGIPHETARPINSTLGVSHAHLDERTVVSLVARNRMICDPGLQQG
mmetsp:Transcript_8168/g.25954  ORF Transcript_8168/g.25954 Transcript_8168/m.25954 type:complete len:334 (+) Transcript_8168:445-1446(+)